MPHYEFFCHAYKKTFSKSLTIAEHEEGKIVWSHCRSKNVEQGWSAFSAILRRRAPDDGVAADAKRKTPFRERKGIAMTKMRNTETMGSRDGP
jgi:hypothetical protein